MNLKKNAVLLSVLAALSLAGCAEETPPSAAPAALVSEVPAEASSTPTAAPTATGTPVTEIPVTEAPDPILEAGPGITVDGVPLTTLQYQDTAYMSASEFLNAAEDVECSGDHETGFTAEKDGVRYEFRPDLEAVLRDGEPVIAEKPVLRNHHTLYLPVEQTCRMLDISVLPDPKNNHIYCTSAAGEIAVEEGVRIPVLMYHGCTDDTWGAAELFVRPERFDAQVAYLMENGYDTITFEDFDHLEDFDKPVMLTFDDGYMDNYLEAFPILQKYGAKATIFLITVSVDRDPRTLTSEQCREMQDSGLVSLQSHTVTHIHLDECDDAELDRQIRQSQLDVARICGKEPFVLCYPIGRSSAHSREVTAQYYQFGINMNGGLYTTGESAYEIPRYYVSRYTTLSEFAAMVRHAGRD